jgi:molybdopterin-guanine dinucleotide biosynthesis protein B
VPVLGKPPLHPDDRHILAVASDAPLRLDALPLFALNEPAAIADLLEAFTRTAGANPRPAPCARLEAVPC